MPRVTKEILQEIKDIPQEGISERTWGRQVDVSLPQVMEERVEVAQLVPQERIQRRTAKEMRGVFGPETQEQTEATVRKVQHVTKVIVDVARLDPHSTHRRTRCGCARTSDPNADRASWQGTPL